MPPDTSFEPCSHRETPTSKPATSQRSLRPLFAQGDPQPIGAVPHHAPSTPVRTGRPPSQRRGSRTFAFDPCSHRETAGQYMAAPTSDPRPLFVQGDPHLPRSSRQPHPSTPFAQGDPQMFLETDFPLPSTPVRTGRPEGSQPTSEARYFNPCWHRETHPPYHP